MWNDDLSQEYCSLHERASSNQLVDNAEARFSFHEKNFKDLLSLDLLKDYFPIIEHKDHLQYDLFDLIITVPSIYLAMQMTDDAKDVIEESLKICKHYKWN